MIETVTCPGCRNPFDVPAGHAASTIRCGICWAEVPVALHIASATAVTEVMVAEPVAAAAKVSPKVLAPLAPGRPLPGMARLDALIQTAALKLPGTAMIDAPSSPAPDLTPPAVPAMAATVRRARRASDDDREETRRPRRGSRDAEDERTNSRRRPSCDEDEDESPRPAGKGPLIAGILVGGFVLLGMAAAVFYGVAALISRDEKPVAAAALTQATPGKSAKAGDPLPPFDVPDPNAAPRGKPRMPFEVPGFNLPPGEWIAVPKADGFTAKMPGEPTVFDLWQEPHFDRDHPGAGRGKRYIYRGGQFDIAFVDIPGNVTADLPKMLRTTAGRATECTIDGHPGLEVSEKPGIRQETRRIVQVGCRIFLFKAFEPPGKADADSVKRFFDSIAITFDPATPAPPDAPTRPKP